MTRLRNRPHERRILRKVVKITASGHVHRHTGRDYPIYHFDCGHTRMCLRFDGIITHFLFVQALAGKASYPMRKCYDCSDAATRTAA